MLMIYHQQHYLSVRSSLRKGLLRAKPGLRLVAKGPQFLLLNESCYYLGTTSFFERELIRWVRIGETAAINSMSSYIHFRSS